MRPTSKRALLEQLARKGPPRGARLWSALALIAIAAIVLVHFLGSTEGAQRSTRSTSDAAKAPFEGVFALPFGQGGANAAAPSGFCPSVRLRHVPELHFDLDRNPDVESRIDFLLKRAKKSRGRIEN